MESDNLHEMSWPIFWENKENIPKFHLKVLLNMLDVKQADAIKGSSLRPDFLSVHLCSPICLYVHPSVNICDKPSI